MRGKRREAQPSGIKTFGSTFKNPEDQRAEGRSAGQLLEAAGCRGLRHGGARFSEKHANFVENAGEATTADVLALMAEGRRRVHERFGVVLEPEVQVLGEVSGRRAGRCEVAAPAVALIVVVIARRRRLQRLLRRHDGDAAISSRASRLRDRQRRGSGRGCRRRHDPRLAAGCPRTASLPQLPLDAPPEGAAAAGAGARTGSRPRRPRRRPCAPTSKAAITAKAGWTSNSTRGSNCASAKRRRPRASGGRPPRCSPIPRSPRSIM